MAGFGRGRNIDARAARKKTARLQMKPGALDWHNGPIFGARNMIRAEHMPQNDVRVLNLAIGARPLGQTRPARMLIWIITCRITLVGAIRRHPQMVIHKTGTPPNRRLRFSQRVCRMPLLPE